MRHLLLLRREIVHALAEKLEGLFEKRRRGHGQPVDVGLGHAALLLASLNPGELAEHGAEERGVGDADGHLADDVRPGEGLVRNLVKREFTRAMNLEEAIGEAERLEAECSHGGALRRVVHDADASLDVLLVRQEGLDEFLGVVGAEVGGLVPPHGVVVHVDLAEASHHLELVVGAVVLLALRRGRVGVLVGEREAVGHLERGADVQAEQLPGHERGRVLGAVLHDLHHHLAVDLHRTERGLSLGGLAHGVRGAPDHRRGLRFGECALCLRGNGPVRRKEGESGDAAAAKNLQFLE